MRHRITLPDGDWVDITPRLNVAQRRRMVAARNTPSYVAESVAAVILGWSVRDADGTPVECPTATVDGIPAIAMDTWPTDTFDAVAEAVAAVLGGAPDPNASAATSAGSSRE